VDEIVQEYGLVPAQLGASSNGTFVAALAKTYKWPEKEIATRRLRCFGHIINLVAQAFMFGAESELFEHTLQAAEQQLNTGGEKLWKLCGPIGKLHYLVIYIRKTPQRRQQFAAGGDGCDPTELIPRRDNSTRWNSTYRMIARALFLRQAIDYFSFQHSLSDDKDKLLEQQLLNPIDWSILAQLADALKVFEAATIASEGHVKDARFGAMWECVPVLEVSNSLIELQSRYPDKETFKSTQISQFDTDPDDLPGANPATEFLNASINRAWLKFQDYYAHTDRSIWYIAGCILNPEQKWAYLEYAWEKSWIITAKGQFKDPWEAYKPAQRPEATARTSLPSRELKSKDSILGGELNAWRHEARKKVKVMDEDEEYLLSPPMEAGAVLDLVLSWGSRSEQWPNLTRLSIPAMSAECERCFSDAGRTITDDRASLGPEAIEACACMKHWLMNKHA